MTFFPPSSSTSSSSSSSSVPADLGYMKITVHEANLSSDLIGPNEVSHVEVSVSNASQCQQQQGERGGREGERRGGDHFPFREVKRQTNAAAGSSPQWNDSMEVRCCLGWDIGISVSVQDPKMSLSSSSSLQQGQLFPPHHHESDHHHQFSGSKSMMTVMDMTSVSNQHQYNRIYHVDNLVAGTCTSGQYYLRRNGKVCGDISLTLEFFPNHQSLKCLVQDVVSDVKKTENNSSLLLLLLGELVTMIRQSAKSRNHLPPQSPANIIGGGALLNDDFSLSYRNEEQSLADSGQRNMSDMERSESVHSSAFVLKEYLSKEAMQSFLMNHHFTASTFSSPASGGRVLMEDTLPPPPPPEAVETFRVAASARTFLNHILLRPLLQPTQHSSSDATPQQSTKQQRPLSGSGSGSSGSNISGVGIASEQMTRSMSRYMAPVPSISLIEKQLLLFTSAVNKREMSGRSDGHLMLPPLMPWNDIISVWFLQHTYVAKTLCDEYRIHPMELCGIRERFEKYDEHLSGDMSADMLSYLLQDMGEYYTHEEISVLRSSVVDADELGVVEFPEFIRWWCSN